VDVNLSDQVAHINSPEALEFADGIRIKYGEITIECSIEHDVKIMLGILSLVQDV